MKTLTIMLEKEKIEDFDFNRAHKNWNNEINRLIHLKKF